MADSKITALTALTSADPANDMIPIVDVSDTPPASGNTKRISINNLLACSPSATLASATITGALTASQNIYVPASTTYKIGPVGSTWGGLRFDSTNQAFLDSDIGLTFRTGGATSFTTSYQIGATGISTWSVAGSTAMTLDASGNLLVGTTSQPSGVSFSRATIKSTSADWSSVIWNSNATPYGFRIQHDTDSNGTGNEFLYCLGATNLRASIRSNGGIANYQANDVSLSDSRMKSDIKPLGSYWNKIKSLEIVTFKYNDQTHNDDNIGLIAQQVESVAPELVDVDGFGETPADGVPLKTIYTTDLYHAAIKALQEAMTRIEVLEAKLA